MVLRPKPVRDRFGPYPTTWHANLSANPWHATSAATARQNAASRNGRQLRPGPTRWDWEPPYSANKAENWWVQIRYGMGLETPLLSKQSGELAGANAISSAYSLPGDKQAVCLEPHSTAVAATAPETLKYDASQTPTVEVSRKLSFAVSKCDEDNFVGPFCIREGYGEAITGGDKVSIHYALFEPSICESYFSTYDRATLDAVAQPEYDSCLWMLKDVLGKKLGERFWCRAHSINCLVEIVNVNDTWSEVLDSSASRRSGMSWQDEETQEQDSESFTSNGALLSEWDSHSMCSLFCTDGASKIGGEDGRSGSVGGAGAGAGAGASTGASTTDRDRENPLQCEIEGCGKTFFDKWSQNRHMLTHLRTADRERRFQCEIESCGKTFFDKMQKKKHMHTHSTNKYTLYSPAQMFEDKINLYRMPAIPQGIRSIYEKLL
ncbi:hypothetical protein V493_01040 [Pseudogymnoascus sp. VKM F-4281 (FW-2241)]|nr:hypothetical protein V493_01040 [Pseudogymnoascus sp. VKM F-4281 (FW-2241)]